MRKIALRVFLALFAVLYLVTHFLPRVHAMEVTQPHAVPATQIVEMRET